MLAKPSVNDIMKKVGTRYEAALAVAKRARQIADQRIEDGDPDITDTVDVATNEIDSDVIKVTNGNTEMLNDDVIKDIVE